MKILIIVLAIVAALVPVIAVLGWITPRRHEASGERQVAASREAVYALVRAVADYPKWRKGVKSVEVSGARYVETNSMGKTPYRILRDEPPGLLVTEIDDPNLPYGGNWTIEIEERGAGSWIRITERGEVKSVFFRGMGRLFFPHDKTLLAYLRDVERHFGGASQ